MDRRIGLVLSGGGARGAYEAGVLAGILDVVGDRAARAPLFDVLTGTSVGAVNAAHLVAYADAPDCGIPGLVAHWRSLRLESHVRPQIARFVAWPGTTPGKRLGRALLDATPFERIVADVPWDRAHENVARGVVKAFIVSALEIAHGRTITFVELAPNERFAATRDHPRRASHIERVTADHVLASAAIPLIFPARRVGGVYYCDGGLRFNTPLAPAIHAGANKLLVVALRTQQTAREAGEAVEQYPNPIFLFGKVLDALLIDPIDHDLRVLARTNRILRRTAETLPAAAIERMARVVESERGLAYRPLETLVFRPSKDLGVLAREHARNHSVRWSLGGAAAALLERVLSFGNHVEADFLSFLLFDRTFTETLIELGRHDVRARANEVHEFFRPHHPHPSPRTPGAFP